MRNASGKRSRFIAAVVGAQPVLERAMALVGALTILALMALTTADVVGRYIFNRPLPGSYEISEFLLIGIVFLAIAYVQSLKGHIKVELLGEQVFKQLSGKAKLAFDIFGHVIGLSVLSIIVWQGWILAWRAWDRGDFAYGLTEVPLWPAKTAFALGISLLGTRLILDLVGDLLALKRGTYES